MSVITSSATLPIGDASTAVESVSVTIIAAAGAYSGAGRLIHPSSGTYDYERAPDEWMNMDGDAIIAPAWATQKTLLGATNTLFVGDLRDVIVEERWTQPTACTAAHVRALLAIWMNPPDPSVAYVEWYPQYTSELGFRVVVLGLSVGNREITFTSQSHAGWVRGPIVLRMRIVERIE